MPYSLLKLLIESACSDGEVSPNDWLFLMKEAEILKISKESMDFLVENELKRVHKLAELQKNTQKSQSTATTNNSSGFITVPSENNPQIGISVNHQIASGFVTENNNFANFSENNNSQNDLASGFITQNTVNELNSGFITSTATNDKLVEENEGKHTFTNVETIANQGAMSLVQKAQYFGKWVIIKRLKPQFKNSADYKRLFFREFNNAFHFSHPNIVQIYGKGADDNGDYYFMDFVDSRTLTELINIEGIKDGELVKKIAVEMLSALDYVHKKQVFHRDLKPDNILVTYKGDNVKIIDFGLAAADSYEDKLIKVGTPLYAAPEQAENGNTVNQTADIYAFGLILLEMLTGQIKNTELAKDRSYSLMFLINRCIQQKPEDRYKNCKEILDDLAKIRITNLLKKPLAEPEKIKTADFNYSTDLQTIKQFFTNTHTLWLSNALEAYENPFSITPTRLQEAQTNTTYEFFLKYANSVIFNKIAQTFHFLQNEFLITCNKTNLLLTNFRLFIYNSANDKLELFSILQLKNENMKPTPIDLISLNFCGQRIWKSDWNIVEKVILTYEPNEKIENLIQLSFAEINSQKLLQLTEQQAEVYLNALKQKVLHTTFNNLMQNSLNFWHSSIVAAWHGNTFQSFTERQKAVRDKIDFFFKNFLPLDGEYVWMQAFHKGCITNFRFIYENTELQTFNAIPIQNIKMGNVTHTASFRSPQNVEIQIADKKIDVQYLHLFSIPETKYEEEWKKTLLFVKHSQMQPITPEFSLLASFNILETNTWWNKNIF